MTCGLVCKSWHADAAETLLRDTAASGRGARRFARAPRGEAEARGGAGAAEARGDASDDRASLRARRESGSAVSGLGPEASGEEEFSSKRRRVDAGKGGGGGDECRATARDDSSVGKQTASRAVR